MLSETERSEARAWWQSLSKQYLQWQEREEWWLEHPDDDDAHLMEAGAKRAEKKFAALQVEFLEWSGADVGEYVDLIGEWGQARLDGMFSQS